MLRVVPGEGSWEQRRSNGGTRLAPIEVHITQAAPFGSSQLTPAPSPSLPLQELVQDDNCEHAALFLPLVGRSCRYKMNQPHYFFECLMLGLEWNRAEHTFRCGGSGTSGGRRAARPCVCPALVRRYSLFQLYNAGCLAVCRLYIDARGEVDLRQPGESSMGFMVHRGGAPDRSAMRERLLELEAR